MIDPFNNMRRYLIWSFILIIFLIISGVAVADNHNLDLDKKSFAEVQEIEWHNADGTIQRSIKVEDGSQKVLYDNVKVMENDADQYCFIKNIIKEKANGDITKEEWQAARQAIKDKHPYPEGVDKTEALAKIEEHFGGI